MERNSKLNVLCQLYRDLPLSTLNSKTNQTKPIPSDTDHTRIKPQLRKPHNPSFDIIHTLQRLWNDANLNTILTDTSANLQISDNRSREIVEIKLLNNSQSRCMVETNISEYSITALIDTGADSCYISEDLCNKLGINFEPYNCDVIVGNNSRRETLQHNIPMFNFLISKVFMSL